MRTATATFFDALMRTQPQLLNDWKAKLWCRFFLLSVFATMFLNDIQKPDFYEAIGLNAHEFDCTVIEKTNETAGRVFPVILDVKHPEFFAGLEKCVKNNENLSAIDSTAAPKVVKTLKKVPYYFSNVVQLVKLYFLKPIDMTAAHGQVR